MYITIYLFIALLFIQIYNLYSLLDINIDISIYFFNSLSNSISDDEIIKLKDVLDSVYNKQIHQIYSEYLTIHYNYKISLFDKLQTAHFIYDYYEILSESNDQISLSSKLDQLLKKCLHLYDTTSLNKLSIVIIPPKLNIESNSINLINQIKEFNGLNDCIKSYISIVAFTDISFCYKEEPLNSFDWQLILIKTIHSTIKELIITSNIPSHSFIANKIYFPIIQLGRSETNFSFINTLDIKNWINSIIPIEQDINIISSIYSIDEHPQISVAIAASEKYNNAYNISYIDIDTLEHELQESEDDLISNLLHKTGINKDINYQNMINDQLVNNHFNNIQSIHNQYNSSYNKHSNDKRSSKHSHRNNNKYNNQFKYQINYLIYPIFIFADVTNHLLTNNLSFTYTKNNNMFIIYSSTNLIDLDTLITTAVTNLLSGLSFHSTSIWNKGNHPIVPYTHGLHHLLLDNEINKPIKYNNVITNLCKRSIVIYKTIYILKEINSLNNELTNSLNGLTEQRFTDTSISYLVDNKILSDVLIDKYMNLTNEINSLVVKSNNLQSLYHRNDINMNDINSQLVDISKYLLDIEITILSFELQFKHFIQGCHKSTLTKNTTSNQTINYSSNYNFTRNLLIVIIVIILIYTLIQINNFIILRAKKMT